ncbi:UvrD-helicase domain-containing protein [Clostridium baratii]|uniref:UvrD-helicase domain-containing protein n=1 Tax=Clostridium baratii TaxID=1561 RepID=UPI003D33F9C4
MILAEQFIKSIPVGYKEKVLNKLVKFEKQLLRCENIIRELPAGYWVRAIKNTNIFKFRLNNKDRILYSYLNKRGMSNEENSEIVFLKYVTHDEQVRVSKNISLENISIRSIEIDSKEYIEESDIENELDNNAIRYCKNGTIDINRIPSIVVQGKDLANIASENYDDFLYYLSNEQYNILKAMNDAVLLSGAGGTGKTVLLLNSLMLAKEYDNKALYVTYNPLLLESIKSTYNKFIDNTSKYCEFKSIKELEKSIYNCCKKTMITYQDIIKWVEENINKYKSLKDRDVYEVVTELNGIIKGYIGIEFCEIEQINKNNSRMISLDKYISISSRYSSFNNYEKIGMYKLAEDYEKWLFNKKLEDENDVARNIILNNNNTKKYDWVIVDEVQDLSEVQIFMLSQLVKNDGHIIWAGDVNQTINPTFFNYGRLKKLYYNKNIKLNNFLLTQNYRATEEIVNFINEVIDSKGKLISKDYHDKKQVAIRNGIKPSVLKFDRKNIDLLIRVLNKKHYCALIVPNEDVKRKIINDYPEIEARVFIVHEIKGLEYENIICYNLLSAYKNIWLKIINGEYKNNDYIKYYFNLLYVSISRAKDRLSFYEEAIEELQFLPFKNCNIVKEFDEKSLGMSKNSSSDEWEAEADNLEKVGQVKKAQIIRDYKLEGKISDVNIDIDNSISELYKNTSSKINATNELEEKMKNGIIKYRQRNYTEALKIFNGLLEEYSQESILNYYIANCYGYMVGGMEYSLRYFWMSIRLEPKKYEYYLDMAAILKTLGKYNTAIEVLDIAKNIFPMYGNADRMKSSVYLDMKQYYKAREFSKASKKLPQYTFDEYNKVWVPPKIKKEVKTYKSIKQDRLSDMKLPVGVNYLKINDGHEIKECINNIEFKSVTYNRKLKRYTIVFNKEMCNLCELYDKCIASKADLYNKISLKQAIVKKIGNYNKLKAVSQESSKEVLENIEFKNKVLEDDKINELIRGLTNKYGENFELSNKNDNNEIAENHKNIKKFTELIMDNKEEDELSCIDKELNECSTKFSNICKRAFNYAKKKQYDKAIYTYNLLINDYLEKYFDELKKFDIVSVLKSYKIYSNLDFNGVDELKEFISAEFHNNLARMYLGKGNYVKAKELLEVAINISPRKYTVSYLSLGDVYMMEENYSMAKEYYSIALKLGNKLGEIGVNNAIKKMYR